MTRQALEQQQLRGDGGSGPYVFGAGTRPGTDRITIEVRARDNAARVIARETLIRFTDYDIDYASGAVLLRRPVPADDPYGNPVFVVAAMERETAACSTSSAAGGSRRTSRGCRRRDVHGLARRRRHRRARRRRRRPPPWCRAPRTSSAPTCGSAPAASPSAASCCAPRRPIPPAARRAPACAGHARGRSLLARCALDARRLGHDRHARSAARRRPDELHFDAALKLDESTRFQLAHDRQHFAQYGIDRQTTTGSAKTSVGGRAVTQELGLSTDVQGVRQRRDVVAQRARRRWPWRAGWTRGSRGATRCARPWAPPSPRRRSPRAPTDGRRRGVSRHATGSASRRPTAWPRCPTPSPASPPATRSPRWTSAPRRCSAARRGAASSAPAPPARRTPRCSAGTSASPWAAAGR